MKQLLFLLSAAVIAITAQASWYWPFGDDDDSRPARLSELMERASELIDEASNLAAEKGDHSQEAVAKYREALGELDRVERENPDRAQSPEFVTLHTKRAYVNAAIDSLLRRQVKDNAKAVSVSDTTALDKRFIVEKWNSNLAEYTALTNANDLTLKRLWFVKSGRGRNLIRDSQSKELAKSCGGALRSINERMPEYLRQCSVLTNADRLAEVALDELKGFPDAVVDQDGNAVVDEARFRASCDRARARIATFSEAFKQMKKTTFDMHKHLEAAYGSLREAAAKEDFKKILEVYSDSDDVEEENVVAICQQTQRDGFRKPCVWMLGELRKDDTNAVAGCALDVVEQAWKGEYAVASERAEGGAKTAPDSDESMPATMATLASEAKVTPIAVPKKPLTKRQEAIGFISRGEFEAAGEVIAVMMKEKPNDAATLNLKAAMEAAAGRYRDAERTLDETIKLCPRDHFAYYNMAELIMKTFPENKLSARRYYETGRSVGGPVDAELEGLLK